MPFTTTIFSSFMGKKKKPRPSNTIDDEVSVVKAAAWAWYQHGSGSEGKPMAKFDIRRMQTGIYRPSRYKLEAMKIAEQKEDAHDNSKTSSSSVHCNNTIGNNSRLDNYEIESISERLDQLIDTTTATKLFSERDHDEGEDEDDSSVSCNSGSNSNAAGTVKKKGKKSGRSWFRHAVICVTREDVVVCHHRLPENRSPMVKSSST